MSTRIYAIFPAGEVEAQALVRAKNRAQALAHFTARNLVVNVAEHDDLIAATKAGVEVEDAVVDEALETATRA